MICILMLLLTKRCWNYEDFLGNSDGIHSKRLQQGPPLVEWEGKSEIAIISAKSANSFKNLKPLVQHQSAVVLPLPHPWIT